MRKLLGIFLGFVPIQLLTLELIGYLPLCMSARAATIPFLISCFFVPKRFWLGLRAGILATLVYDVARIGFCYLGLWRDFVPGIGDFLVPGTEYNWFWGYLWRFIFNGGMMGAAYVCLFRKPNYLNGLAFGLSVCGGLFLTLIVFPMAQHKLFYLTPASVLMAITGHIVYGIILGAYSVK